MNVVFLDIDGVLNSSAYFQFVREQQKENCKSNQHCEISDYHLQRLAEIVHSTNAKIVLSSTWRELEDSEDEEVQKMWQYLQDELGRYDMEIYDKTPVLKMNRPLEIKTWLDNQENKEEICFVSLDDDFSETDYEKVGLGNCLIKTRFFCHKMEYGGLQPIDVAFAIDILKNKKSMYKKG